MSVLFVDWLGRGGIAQTTIAWARAFQEAGIDTVVVARRGREIDDSGLATVGPVPSGGPAVLAHRRLVRSACDEVLRRRPRVVVVQNYVLPILESPVHEAARRSGARLIQVIHDHRLHSILAGNRVGTSRLSRWWDVIVSPSAFVATRVAEHLRRDVSIVPLPLPVGILSAPRRDPFAQVQAGERLALHLGVVRRRYKGADLVATIAKRGLPGWSFGVIGPGAKPSPGLHVVPGFVEGGTLAGAVARSRVTLLPYRIATQSAAVVLAQALGCVPIVSDVGALGEQVDRGSAGLLLDRGATVDEWLEALVRLEDDRVHHSLVRAGRNKVKADHRESVTRMVQLGS